MSVISKVIVNTGARLYRKKYKRAAMRLWALPGVLSSASPVNIKKYLVLTGDAEFTGYVKRNYFSISKDNELLAWVYSEALARNLESLLKVMEKGFSYQPGFVAASFQKCLEKKNYLQLSILIRSFDKAYVLTKENNNQYNRLLVGGLYQDSEVLKDISLEKKSGNLLKMLLGFYRDQKIGIPNSISRFILKSWSELDKGVLYSYCQAVQTLEGPTLSVDKWEKYLSFYSSDLRARQNLMLQQCKLDSQGLLVQFKWLSEHDGLTEKLIDQSYRAANRINSVDFLNELNSFKKKTQYSLKVSLEIARKNDYMEVVEGLQVTYLNEYGLDKWLKTFKAKKFIDFGLYPEAIKDFKAIKGQKLYYGISLLKNKQIDKAYKVFLSFKPDNKDYFSAQRNLADINFYENSNWKLAASSYQLVLNNKFDYQVNLRYLKSCVLIGSSVGDLDLSKVNREDQFYLKYLSTLQTDMKETSLRFLNQIYSDSGLKPLFYKEGATFFDSIGSRSKPVVGDKLVSVVMTAYKAKVYIDKAIDSILNQSYKNLELIIVEDHSSDGTYEYIKSKYSSQVLLVRTEENSGTYVAKNLGMKLAKGEYITFMDSDDWSHPDRIAKQVKELEINPSIVACQTGHLRMSESGDILFRKRGVNLDVPISLMIRKRVVSEIGCFDSVRFSGDSEFIGRLTSTYGKGSIGFNRAPLILARQAEGSLTTSGKTALTWAGMPKVRIDYRRVFREKHRLLTVDLASIQ